jgi:hypothetical protein
MEVVILGQSTSLYSCHIARRSTRPIYEPIQITSGSGKRLTLGLPEGTLHKDTLVRITLEAEGSHYELELPIKTPRRAQRRGWERRIVSPTSSLRAFRLYVCSVPLRAPLPL